MTNKITDGGHKPTELTDDDLDFVQGAGKGAPNVKGVVLSTETVEPSKGVVLSSESAEPSKRIILTEETETI